MAVRSVFFNAPAMSRADINSAVGRYLKRDGKPTNELLEYSRSDVISNKGWLTPDTTYEEDFQGNNDTDPETEDGAPTRTTPPGPMTWNQNSNTRPTVTDDSESESTSYDKREVSLSTLFPNNEQYGFRFMYNPPEIGFQLAQTTGISIPFVMSGRDKANPIRPTGSSITLTLTISRVDDLAVMQPLKGGDLKRRLGEITSLYDEDLGFGTLRNPEVANQVVAGSGAENMTLKLNHESRVKLTQLMEIAELGTMHDLNYLFRSVMARNWKTAYRGVTADTGLFFSVPLVLNLGNPKMMYRVLLTNVQYSHRLFTPDMIPTFTEVSLVFTRIPDVVAWDYTENAPPVLKERE